MGKESWATRIGVILAVMGSAIGLGNFLRFPGLAAQYEGGAFMIPYFVAFILVGLPIAWAEWTMGRYGGTRGYNSMPGIFRVIANRNGAAPFVGVLGLIIPVIIYMYYVFIEAWCLGYAINFLTGSLAADPNLTPVQQREQFGAFFTSFVGASDDGAIFQSGLTQSVLPFLLICVVLNFFLIYRGLSKGIEMFCQIALPLLVILALVILVRVLTLPDVSGGLAMTWNPVVKVDYLAAGDKSLQGFLAANQARKMLGGEVQIEDIEDFEKQLAKQGWTRPAVAGEPDADQIPWRHKEGTLGVTVTADGHVHLFRKASLETARLKAWEPIEKFDELEESDMPVLRLMLTEDEDAPTIQQLVSGDFKLPSGEVYTADAELAGWKPLEAGNVHGLWVHDGSKLRMDWINDSKTVTVEQRPFISRLMNPDMWLAAAGQIFFSLSVGFGVIICYSSYMKRRDDVALSGLTAASGNGFAEVCLGGMITIPAAFLLLGAAGVNEHSGSTFSLGFVTLPNVFATMPAGSFFGFLFFFLLFLAAVTSSLSMLQPAIAFLEEGLGIGRKASVTILGSLTIVGTFFVVYFSKGFTALDTLDFWIGTFCIFILATVQVVMFGWVLGTKKGMEEMERGAEIKLPPMLAFVLKYVSPVFLLVIFGAWAWQNFLAPLLGNTMPARIEALVSDTTVQLSVGFMILVTGLFLLLIGVATKRWAQVEAEQGEPDFSEVERELDEEVTS